MKKFIILTFHGNNMKVVCFGGGKALPEAVLSGLKKYKIDITSITSMVDSGGSSGRLRKELNVLPPGDIRRHLIALSEAPKWKKDLFELRFGQENFGEGHIGHSFGNLFIAGLEHILKDYEKVLEIVHQFLEVKGRCLPATIERTTLCAVLENGETIEGEDEIDVPKRHDPNLRIKEIFLKPRVKAYERAVEAVEDSDLVIIGPGDLYSSILPCFLPEGMSDAIKESNARKIFVCPPLTKTGETNNFSVLDFTKEVERYIGCELDFIIYNTQIPSEDEIISYKLKNNWVYGAVKIDDGLSEKKFIGANLLNSSKGIVYDSDKLAELIINLASR